MNAIARNRNGPGDDPCRGLQPEQRSERPDQQVRPEVTDPVPLELVELLEERAVRAFEHHMIAREVRGVVAHLRIGREQHRQAR
jgi:hypothetical protein